VLLTIDAHLTLRCCYVHTLLWNISSRRRECPIEAMLYDRPRALDGRLTDTADLCVGSSDTHMIASLKFHDCEHAGHLIHDAGLL
jgi:hypothetical protein